jgi:proliferating cell nuclear antigen
MKLVTVQASAIKCVFEVLKDILNDVNIFFRPTGVFVTTLDSARSSLIDLQLLKENFEEYECEEEMIAGVNISNVFKILKSVASSDVLTMSIDAESREVMKVKILSDVKKTTTEFDLKLLDINDNRIEVPEIQMTTVTTIPSTDFQRLCRDMSNIGSEIEITREKNILTMSCAGDFANQQTSIECVEESPVKMSGLYALRYLNIFTKATSLCSSVQLMQEEENRFLVLKYSCASLGDLHFYLATKLSE